jgi:ribosomal protein S12 methylthiotransferase
MELQQGISLQINQSFVGKTLPILTEGTDKGITIGRSYRDAPEIDGLVLLEAKAEIGEIVPVKITGAMAYDLTAQPLDVKAPVKPIKASALIDPQRLPTLPR